MHIENISVKSTSMKSPIRPDYRISKKISKPVFDLKDMLVIVEALEEEAIANELIGISNVVN